MKVIHRHIFKNLSPLHQIHDTWLQVLSRVSLWYWPGLCRRLLGVCPPQSPRRILPVTPGRGRGRTAGRAAASRGASRSYPWCWCRRRRRKAGVPAGQEEDRRRTGGARGRSGSAGEPLGAPPLFIGTRRAPPATDTTGIPCGRGQQNLWLLVSFGITGDEDKSRWAALILTLKIYY